MIQTFRKLPFHSILPQKFGLNGSCLLNFVNMCSSHFDWSIETMDPRRSRQKALKDTPGTNWFAGRQLAADYPCQGDF